MTELEKKAYAYVTKRQKDPNYPAYNWVTEISDAYEQGYKDAIDGELFHVLEKGKKIGYKDAVDKTVEFLKYYIGKKYNFFRDEDIEVYKKAMEDEQWI